MKKRKKLRKNLAALIALSLLFLSAFVFPLFGTSIFGESFSNKSTVIINLIKDVFNSKVYLNSGIGFLQLLLVVTFLFGGMLYLLNGLGVIYNRYSRYASFLTLAYFFIGLILYNSLNNEYATSFFGFELSSVSLGLGIYFVPLVGIAYLFLAKHINRAIKLR